MKKYDFPKNKDAVQRSSDKHPLLKPSPLITLISRLFLPSRTKDTNTPVAEKRSAAPSPQKRSMKLKKWLFISIAGFLGLSFYLQSLSNSNFLADELKDIINTITSLTIVALVVSLFVLFLKTIKPLCLVFFTKKQTEEIVLPTIGVIIFISAFIGFFGFIITHWGK